MVEPALIVLAAIIALGLAFDFVNGFHDTANAIATSVATRVLSPGQAVSMAAVLNVVGAVSGTAVATTVGRGIVPPAVATQQLVAAALIAARTIRAGSTILQVDTFQDVGNVLGAIRRVFEQPVELSPAHGRYQ